MCRSWVVAAIIVFACVGPSARGEKARWDELLTQASMLDTNGWFDSAIVVARQALAVIPQTTHARDSATVRIYLNMGNFFGNAEREDSMFFYISAAERLARKVYSRTSREYCKLAKEAGNASYWVGKYSEAATHYKHILRQFDGDDREGKILRAEVSGSLGATYCSLGKYEKAGNSYLAAVEIYRQLFPIGHPRNSKAQLNYAMCRRYAGREHDAIVAEEQAVVEPFSDLDELNEADARDYVDLGDYMLENGRPDLADTCYRYSLQIRERVHAPTHRHIATPLIKLGQLCEHLGRTDEAEAYYQRAIAVLQPLVPPGYKQLQAVELALKNLREPSEDVDLRDDN